MRTPSAHERLASRAMFGRATTFELWCGRAHRDPAVRWLAAVEIARRHPVYARGFGEGPLAEDAST
jgi:hypothetical protein